MTTQPSYVIGDIQGCQDRLDLLLRKIEQAAPEARLIFVGDLVNRGPRSLQTLRQVCELGSRARTVLGNHDLHLLAVAHGIRPPHRSDTLDEILDAPDRDDLLEWLRHQPLALYEQEHLIVHAGVLPQWTAQKTLALAGEVEAVLRGPDWLQFLRQMYGNTPVRWDENLTGADRLRCIVNALTRLRFCSADGTMDLTSKGVETAVPGYMPWFEVPGRRSEDVTVVFGHWSTLGLMLRPGLISLDTGCLWGGKLTAVSLGGGDVIQVDCPQYQVPGSL
jgi:bis(5'-nucleosyl)-tetraphosphatase (symmetrical)